MCTHSHKTNQPGPVKKLPADFVAIIVVIFMAIIIVAGGSIISIAVMVFQ